MTKLFQSLFSAFIQLSWLVFVIMALCMVQDYAES